MQKLNYLFQCYDIDMFECHLMRTLYSDINRQFSYE